MSFKVIPPLTLTTAMLTSSTVGEPDAGEVVYNSGATYAVDDVVIDPATHRKYSSLVSGNIGNPLPVWPEKQTTNWFYVGRTNRWAMFDLLTNKPTVSTGPVTIVLTPGVRVDSLALRGLKATSAAITMTAGGVQVYSRTIDLNRREVRNWYDYFFAEFGTRPSVTLHDLPPYANGIITVVLTNAFGAVSCAAFVIGRAVELGDMVAEPESDVRNFSTIDRDADGTATLVQRRNVPTLVSSILCDKSNVNKIRELRNALNASPAVYSGMSNDTDGYAEAVDILGIYTRFTISLKHPSKAVISLQLEDL